MSCTAPLETSVANMFVPTRAAPGHVRSLAGVSALVQPAPRVRVADPCPFPLRVVALGEGGADAAALLAPSPMIALQAELALTPQSIRELVMLGPDVVVVDLRNVTLGQVASQLRRIHGASPRSRIVTLVPSDAAFAHQALVGGATACISDADDPVAMLRAVHDAARNRMHQGGAARQVMQRVLPV